MNSTRHMSPLIAFVLVLLIMTQCRGRSVTPVKATPSPPGPRQKATPKARLPTESPPPGAATEFKTDFSVHTVPYSEILSGGPPKDGIPALTNPKFISVEEANAWLSPQEPVIHLAMEDDVRAYPIQILIWHEIVNDVIGTIPVVVTFCPLCNTAIAFDRQLDDLVLTFGTTGRLRFSNLIMYDRETESWWQQATGETIAGKLTGNRLRFLPATIVAWTTFKTKYPQGQVLSRDTGYQRPYGRNPYLGYDSVATFPFLYEGPKIPDKLPPKERVLTVSLGSEAVAYPYTVLKQERVVNDTVGNTDIVVFWQPGTASPLESAEIPAGKDVGTAAAFARVVDGEETHTIWDITGKGVKGPLRGKLLKPIISINHFWFSWAAFRPDTRIYRGGNDGR